MKGWDDCPKCHGEGGWVVGGLTWADWRPCWKQPKSRPSDQNGDDR